MRTRGYTAKSLRVYRILLATVISLAGCSPDLGSLRTLPYDAYTYDSEPNPKPTHPEEIQRTYLDADGVQRPYLVQEPSTPDDDAPVLVFVHGADSGEELGMAQRWGKGCFTELRNAMAERGWIYISIRDYEWEGLRHEINAQYGARTLLLVANSAGGAATLKEVVRHPQHYDGLILSCPALYRLENQQALTMPILLAVGENDAPITGFCRRLAASLTAFNPNFGYVEIPGAGHAEPLLHANWGAQVDFVYERMKH